MAIRSQLNRFSLAAVLLLASFVLSSACAREADKRVRTIYHKDGGKTLSEKDNNTGVLKEFTYNKNNLLLLKKQFQIDRKGRARQGQIFDAAGNLLARVEYGFDQFGRMEEERMFNANAQVIRRLLYRYDSKGNRLRPTAYTYPEGLGSPQEMDASQVPQTIMTPEVNGTTEIPGYRYEEGTGGMQQVPSTGTSPIRRGGSSDIRR